MTDDLYNIPKDPDINQYQDEIKQRWGNTDTYKQSMKKINHMTQIEMAKLKADGEKFTQTIADNMDKGVSHPDVQSLIKKHHDGIEFFYNCPLAMYKNIGQMYVDDTRFTAYYDKYKPGLAIFMRDAINYFCDKNS